MLFENLSTVDTQGTYISRVIPGHSVSKMVIYHWPGSTRLHNSLSKFAVLVQQVLCQCYSLLLSPFIVNNEIEVGSRALCFIVNRRANNRKLYSWARKINNCQ